MNLHTHAAARIATASATAIALSFASATPAHARTAFTPLQATAATADCHAVAVPVPDGWQGGVIDIKDSGVLVGSVLDPNGIEHATYWTPDGPASAGGYTRHSPDILRPVNCSM